MTDPTTSAAWIVAGEQELGPQRRCAECREWYPLVPEFWDYRDKPDHRTYLQPCRACRLPARAAYLVQWRRRQLRTIPGPRLIERVPAWRLDAA